jgi:hypothetical protein
LVPADKFLPLNDELIPTGKFSIYDFSNRSFFFFVGQISSIENTPFDFRALTRIGERINESFDGYDMMFVIDGDGKRPFGK